MDEEFRKKFLEALQAITEAMKAMSKNIEDLAHCVKTQDATMRIMAARIVHLETEAGIEPKQADA